jgi:molybdopterin synthase catalytic subunit
VREAAVAARPGLAPIAAQLRVAVNHTFVDASARVAADDEVALLPPVSGGAGRHARITEERLELGRVVAAVSDDEHGAVATFAGVVRRTSEGRRVSRLDYEAYGPMAVRALQEILEELERRWPGVRLAAEHRTGELEIGELAVVVAAGAAHRREALSACAAAIDEIKARVPIWKREHTEEGGRWVGCDGCARAHG